jgi:hypothetical protein
MNIQTGDKVYADGFIYRVVAVLGNLVTITSVDAGFTYRIPASRCFVI